MIQTTQEKSLYEIVNKQYLKDSNVIAPETRRSINKYAQNNKLLSEIIEGKYTTSQALITYKGNSDLKKELTELIGYPVSDIMSEMEQNEYTSKIQMRCAILGPILGVSYMGIAGAASEVLPLIEGIMCVTGTFVGVMIGEAQRIVLPSYLIQKKETEPRSRAKFLDEVIQVYNQRRKK